MKIILEVVDNFPSTEQALFACKEPLLANKLAPVEIYRGSLLLEKYNWDELYQTYIGEGLYHE